MLNKNDITEKFHSIQDEYQEKLSKHFYDGIILPFCKKWGLDFYSGMGTCGFLNEGEEIEFSTLNELINRFYDDRQDVEDFHSHYIPYLELDDMLLDKFLSDLRIIENDIFNEKEILIAIGNNKFDFEEYRLNTGAKECVFS